MNLKPEEISSVIKEEIKRYSSHMSVAEVGTVIQVADGIARIHGLEKAMQGVIKIKYRHKKTPFIISTRKKKRCFCKIFCMSSVSWIAGRLNSIFTSISPGENLPSSLDKSVRLRYD